MRGFVLGVVRSIPPLPVALKDNDLFGDQLLRVRHPLAAAAVAGRSLNLGQGLDIAQPRAVCPAGLWEPLLAALEVGCLP
jgi:hypothetical protein